MAWANWSQPTWNTAQPAAVPTIMPSTAMTVGSSAVPPAAVSSQYSNEQWAAMQQQNWQQWVQWQQQYQQWQQQYGEQYQKALAASAAPLPVNVVPTSIVPTAIQSSMAAAQPPLPPMATDRSIPPPPPESKPPPPPDDNINYTTKPPFPAAFNFSRPPPYGNSGPPNFNQTSDTSTTDNVSNFSANLSQPPPPINTAQNFSRLPPEIDRSTPVHDTALTKTSQPSNSSTSQPPSLLSIKFDKPPAFDASQNQGNKRKYPEESEWAQNGQGKISRWSETDKNFKQPEDSELKLDTTYSSGDDVREKPVNKKIVNPSDISEAEKKFDEQFKAWEEQFNKWKEQNVNHPDKQQYKEYEAKWEAWRNQLLERREQMRRKRLLAKGAPSHGNTPQSQSPETAAAEPKVSKKSEPQKVDKPFVKKMENLDWDTQEHKESNKGKELKIGTSIYDQPPKEQRQKNQRRVRDRSDSCEIVEIPESPERDIDGPQSKQDYSFIPSSLNAGIPGLDLVDANKREECKIEDKPESKPDHEPDKTGDKPDYEAISRGINNILGDQKLMNMLSMVSQNKNSNTPKSLEETGMSDVNKSVDNSTFSARNDGPFQDDVNQRPYYGNNSCADRSNSFEQQNLHGTPGKLPSLLDLPKIPPPLNVDSGSNFQNKEQSSSTFNLFRNDTVGQRKWNEMGYDNRSVPNLSKDNYELDRMQNDRPSPFDRFRDDTDGPQNTSPGKLFDNAGSRLFDHALNQGQRLFSNNHLNQGSRPFDNSMTQGLRQFDKPGLLGDRPYDNFGNSGSRSFDKFNQTGRSFDNNGPRPFDKFENSTRPFDNVGNNGSRPFSNSGNGPNAGNTGPRSFGNSGLFDNSRNSGPGLLDSPINHGNRSFDNSNQNQRPFDGPNSGPRPLDGPNSGQRPFDGPNSGQRPFDGPNSGQRSFDGPNSGPRSFDGPNSGPRSFDGPNSGTRPFDGPNSGTRSFDGPSSGPRSFDGPNSGPRPFDGPNSTQRPFDGPNSGQRPFDGPNSGQRSFDDSSSGPRPFDSQSSNFNRNNNDQMNDRWNSDRFSNFPDQTNRSGPVDNYMNRPGQSFDSVNFNDRPKNYFEQQRRIDQPNTADNSENYPDSKFMDPDDQKKGPPGKYNQVPPWKDEFILSPATVVDYGHKPVRQQVLEPDEPFIEPVQTFDYGHTSKLDKNENKSKYSEKSSNFLSSDNRSGNKWSDNRSRNSSDDYRKNYNRDKRDNYNNRDRRDNYNKDKRDIKEDKDERSSYYNSRYSDNRFSPRPDEKPLFNKNRYSDPSPNFSNRDHQNKPSNTPDTKNAPQNVPVGNIPPGSGPINEPHSSKQSNLCFWEDDFEGNFENAKGWKQKDEHGYIKNDESNLLNINESKINSSKNNLILIDDILSMPGRATRPPRIVIILRGPPGSGKTFLAKLIKDKEVEQGGSAPRILSLDDYFMVEIETDTTDPETGRKMKTKQMVYEYEQCMESSYLTSLIKAFKKTINDGFFSFIIVDCVNDKVKQYVDMWSFAKQKGFQVYVCQMELDVALCTKRNIHNRTEEQVSALVKNWESTPSHHLSLDATSLIQSGSIPEVEMDDVSDEEEPSIFDQTDSADIDEENRCKSKWETMEPTNDKLARLDGTNKPLRTQSMKDYLQLDDEWKEPELKPGQKRVRWADLVEKKEQEKMRAIGFVVGQTDWSRMMDPTQGSGALTQTKFFETSRK